MMFYVKTKDKPAYMKKNNALTLTLNKEQMQESLETEEDDMFDLDDKDVDHATDVQRFTTRMTKKWGDAETQLRIAVFSSFMH